MPVARRAIRNFDNLDLPLSYNVTEKRNILRDCSNVYSNQGKLEKRYGTSLFNSTNFAGDILSLSYFKSNAGTAKVFAKIGEDLKCINESTVTTVKTGLTATTKHRGVTWNGIHVMCIESDGLFECNGTVFGPIGTAAPAAPTLAALAGGSLTDATWTVKLTFYSSTEAFESNAGAASAGQATAAPNKSLTVSDIPTTSTNVMVDKVRLYASKDNTTWYYVKEITLGTATTTITADPTSTSVPPTKNGAPISGGGKYPAIFRDRFVYAGNSSYPNDVFFSEPELHDAFDETSTALKLYAKGDGVITGLATGFFNNSVMDPYLVVFKERCTWIYSDINSEARFTLIDENIGCVNHDTIQIRNGDIIFQSQRGWHMISNGRIAKDEEGNLSMSHLIDDMYSSPGFDRYLNKTEMDNFHAAYYPTLDYYMSFISESGSTDKTRAYVYEFSSSKGFKIFDFPFSVLASCRAEDSNGNPIIILGTTNYLFKHSIIESKDDIDENGTVTAINAYALFTWSNEWDWDASYNYREIIVRGLVETISSVEIRGMTNFVSADYSTFTTYFSPNSENVFILDVSTLDDDSFGEGRINCTARGDINRVGESLSVGFYQNEKETDMILTGFQIHYSKNGNRN